MKIIDILSKLDNVRERGDGYIACCPAHDDRHPSLSIMVYEGKILMHCHAGCGIEEICEALDISVKDLFTEEGDSYEWLLD